MLSTKGDYEGALTENSALIAKFPDSDLAPSAMLTLGQAQKELGRRDPKLRAAAVATFKELAQKFPKSEVTPFSYFSRAAMFQDDKNYPELEAVMREFISGFPESDRLFAAYDYIAQIQALQKQPQDAIATYEQYLGKNPATSAGGYGNPESQRSMEEVCCGYGTFAHPEPGAERGVDQGARE